MGQVEIWARPGSAEDRIRWDPWRRRWTVSCRAAAVEGEANAALKRLMAGWLAVPEDRLAWLRAGRSRAKRLSIDGLDDAEIDRRLVSASEAGGLRTESPG